MENFIFGAVKFVSFLYFVPSIAFAIYAIHFYKRYVCQQ